MKDVPEEESLSEKEDKGVNEKEINKDKASSGSPDQSSLNKKLLIVLGIVVLGFVSLIIAFASSGPTQSPEARAGAAERVYLQWAILMLKSDPEACGLMTSEAQEAYVKITSLPEDIQAEGCEAVVPIITEGLNLKEPYIPSELLSRLDSKISSIDPVSEEKTILETKDFANGKQPLVIVREDNKWLIGPESFEGL